MAHYLRKIKDKDKRKKLEDAWLNIDVDPKLIINPLVWPMSADEDPTHYLIWIMTRIEYIWFFCKHILGVELTPMQCLILKELWNRKFPMLIQTRGGGKCIKDSYVMLDNKFIRINELVKNTIPNVPTNINYKIYGENGFKDIEYGWKNSIDKTVKLETQNGYSIEGTLDHPIRIVDNDLKWKKLTDLNGEEYVIIDRSTDWFENTNNLSEDEAYLFGCLVGDGGYTVRGRISFTTIDKSLLNKINSISLKLWDKKFKRASKNDKINFNLYSVEIYDKLFNNYGFNSSVCAEKDFPSSVLGAKKKVVASFIRGLFDTDGTCNKDRLRLEYCSKSKKLIETLQFILTRFGIISRVKSRLNKKYNTIYFYLTIDGDNARIFHKEIGFNLVRKQTRLSKLIKLNSNTNNDIIPKCLIYDKLINLFEIFKKTWQNKELSVWRLKKYDLTYSRLSKLLMILEEDIACKYQDDFIYLKNLLDKHYYFDRIKNISYGFSETYDVHIPDDHSFISGGFISHNTFLLALYALIRCLLIPNRKIVICAAAFRQSKNLFQYIEKIFYKSKILQNIVAAAGINPIRHEPDQYTFYINGGSIIACPTGTGETIRGLRANDLITDEFNSLPREIFETVMAGFTAVRADPLDNMKYVAARKKGLEMGIWEDEYVDEFKKDNQLVISGTAGYTFQHFYEYWKDWHDIIASKGDPKKVKEYFTKKSEAYGQPPETLMASFKWSDYSIIRIPFELMPEGFMDEAQIARAKATMHSGTYMSEYGATFAADSNGFFKRSLIDSCTVSNKNIFSLSQSISGLELFRAILTGNPNGKYVIGVDPASEHDNFSIVVVELHPTHRRIVYAWTTTKDKHKELVKEHLITEQDFFAYCAKKIRWLYKKFPCERIMLDSQGGGYSILEALHDPDKMERGDEPFWPVIIPDKEQDTDNQVGKHIVEIVQFASAEWTSQANNGLRKDMEDKALLFPLFDPVVLANAEGEDKINHKKFDTLEDCVMEIEELKDEMSTIVLTRTSVSGRDRWDTPETKLPGGKKGRMRKDRYSALLMANMGARQIARTLGFNLEASVGGFADGVKREVDGPLYQGGSALAQQLGEVAKWY